MYNKNTDMAVKLADLVSQQGGTAYFVGGYVRDKLRTRITRTLILRFMKSIHIS